jgi:hypothetical protein
MQEKCYTFVKVPLTKTSSYPAPAPLFEEKHVAATYVIHLEGNGRLQNVYNEFKKTRPSKLIYILMNKGYRKCKKKLPKQNARYDLIHAFLTVFKHAKKNGYKMIMVLEDDFQFTPAAKNNRHIQNIKNFIEKKTSNVNTNFIYSLGSLSSILFPVSINCENYFGLSRKAHCMIYNSHFIDETLQKPLEKIRDWDAYTFLRYTYKTTICGQLIVDTENSSEWCSPFDKLIAKILKVNKQIEPGYTIHNYFARVFSILAIVLVVLTCVKIASLKNHWTRVKVILAIVLSVLACVKMIKMIIVFRKK